jgi:AraC-like DNA-binding protein
MGKVTPTVCAGLVRGDLEAARALGLDTGRILTRADLREAELDDPDGRIAFERFIALWEAIAAEPRVERFAVRLGDELRLDTLGVMGYVLAHSGTVGAALAATERFGRLLGAELIPRRSLTRDRLVLSRALPPRLAATRVFAEATLVGTAALVERLAGTPPRIVELHFQHERGPGAALVEERLGCPIRYGAGETLLAFPRAVADLPVRGHDPALLQILERHAATLHEQVPAESSVSAQVRGLVRDALPHGEPAQAEVARKLAMSERTLQRRLRDERTTFAALVEGVRAEVAKRHLTERRMAVYEIAFLLGYSDPSAFHRAFRRWTGVTPQAFRAQAGSRPAMAEPDHRA